MAGPTRPVCLLLSVLLAGACHRGGRDTVETAPEPEVDPNAPVEVLVRSFHSQPVRVFLMRGGSTLRLGVVAEGRGRTFVIPREFYGRGISIRFLFTLVGGGPRLVSDAMTFRPGNYIEWTIAERLQYSTVFVW